MTLQAWKEVWKDPRWKWVLGISIFLVLLLAMFVISFTHIHGTLARVCFLTFVFVFVPIPMPLILSRFSGESKYAPDEVKKNSKPKGEEYELEA